MFEKVVAAVFGYLGISAFAKDKDGKSSMSKEQETKLEEKYGKKFVEEFKKDLSEFEKEGKTAESAVTEGLLVEMEADKEKNAKELEKARERISKLEEEKAKAEAKIAKLEKEETADAGKVVTGANAENMGKGFKADMSLAHNKYVDAIYYGKPGASYSGNTTIETTELQNEFGKYVNSERLEILRSLMGKTESTVYVNYRN